MKLTRRKTRAEVPSMAMGDIAFNLLIFFAAPGRFVRDQSHHAVVFHPLLDCFIVQGDRLVYFANRSPIGREVNENGFAFA